MGARVIETSQQPGGEPAFADRVRSAVYWRAGSQIAAQLVMWTATILEPTEDRRLTSSRGVFGAHPRIAGAVSELRCPRSRPRKLGMGLAASGSVPGTVLAVFVRAARLRADVARLRYQAETRGADSTVVIESGGSGRANR